MYKLRFNRRRWKPQQPTKLREKTKKYQGEGWFYDVVPVSTNILFPVALHFPRRHLRLI